MQLGLSEENAQKVIDQIGEELKGYIPKSRFDEINQAKKNAEDSLKERDKQIESLKNLSGDAEKLKDQISQLQEQNKQAEKDHAAQIRTLRLDNAVANALTEAKAKNQKAVKALLDLANAEVGDDGTVKGLKEQIDALKASDDSSFMFDAVKAPSLHGAKTGEDGHERDDDHVNLDKMSYDELSSYFEAHPDAIR